MPDFAKFIRQLRPLPVKDQPQGHLFEGETSAVSLSHQLQYLKARHPVLQSGSSSVEPMLPKGEEEITPYGRHYVVRKILDSEHCHGKVRLGRFSCDDLRRLMTVMQEKEAVPDRDSIVYLDTETTGMQGAGMVPFLVGLGYFKGDDFHIVQYFIRDFDEEPAMLHALGKMLEEFRLVVTYNGATFDIPLLESRFILARFENPLLGMPHLDLLTGARRLWRNGHGSCRLVALEREIVSFLRGPDIPGSMIPRVYFDFVNRGSSSVHPEDPAHLKMKSVFTHNVYDIVSLAALTVCACDRVTAEPALFDNPLDLYSLARILENTPDWKRSRLLYEIARQSGLPEPACSRAGESLAVLYRRSGEHERALAICMELIRSTSFSMVAFEGAAIYHERIEGNHVRALEIVDEALARLESSAEHKSRKTLLLARRERLRQKVIQF
jgi:uncharacterized protein YprB with RNaseH-like and TPR domain